MGEFEAIGDAVTGGVVGRAVEPKAGEAGDGHTHESNCLNCGCALVGEYCHCCGQRAHIHRTLSAFFHDLLHGVLHFEGKIWRTLPLLAWKPGELTRRYIDGQRASFVSPIALFLFSVFLMFAVMELTGALDSSAGRSMRTELAQEVADARETIAELERDRAEAAREGRQTEPIDQRLANAREDLAAIQSAQARKIDTEAFESSEDVPGWLGGMVDKASKNPELLFYKVKTNAYKFSWALIPISVPFVWLLFPFSRRFRMYDHTVFVTYSLSFMTLLLVVGSALGLVLPSIASLLFFVPPFHMYWQLRGTYALSRWGALWRMTLLVGFAFAAIGLFASLLVGLGALN
jgi:ABC-type multidrug transport system fused ATPase/permease subunit